MTQIKIFTGKTFQGSPIDPKTPTIEKLTQKVNDFLLENDGKITIKDIKYTIQSPTPNGQINSNVKDWTVMVIYETH